MAFGRKITIISGASGDTGTSISNCRISFEIEKNLTKTPNKATVQLYNLSSDTMTKMGKRLNKLVIKAGYEDENSLSALFYGDINESSIEKNPPEKILKIEAYDGYKYLNSETIALSVTKGTQISTVFDKIIDKIAYPIGGTKPTISGAFNAGYTFNGYAKDALTQVLTKARYKWTVQNEQIYIYSGNSSPKKYELKLTSDTGLLDITKIDPDINSTKNSTKTYYKIQTLLFPQIIPGATVYVKSDLATGNMVVQSVKFTGDNFDGDFMAEAEVRAA
jgi:hypothetical protein